MFLLWLWVNVFQQLLAQTLTPSLRESGLNWHVANTSHGSWAKLTAGFFSFLKCREIDHRFIGATPGEGKR